MASTRVVNIPTTVVTANGTTLSDAVELKSSFVDITVFNVISARTDGTLTVTIQTSDSLDGPWATWFAGLGITTVTGQFSYPGITDPSTGALFMRISAVATLVTSGFTFRSSVFTRTVK